MKLSNKLFSLSGKVILDKANGLSNGHWAIFSLSDKASAKLAEITAAFDGSKWNSDKLPYGFKRCIDTTTPVRTTKNILSDEFYPPKHGNVFTLDSLPDKDDLVRYKAITAGDCTIYAYIYAPYWEAFGKPNELHGTSAIAPLYGDNFIVMPQRP